MEAANEAARRAVNGILDARGSDCRPLRRVGAARAGDLRAVARARLHPLSRRDCRGTTRWCASACRCAELADKAIAGTGERLRGARRSRAPRTAAVAAASGVLVASPIGEAQAGRRRPTCGARRRRSSSGSVRLRGASSRRGAGRSRRWTAATARAPRSAAPGRVADHPQVVASVQSDGGRRRFQAHLSNYRETTLAGLLSAVPQREPQPLPVRPAVVAPVAHRARASGRRSAWRRAGRSAATPARRATVGHRHRDAAQRVPRARRRRGRERAAPRPADDARRARRAARGQRRRHAERAQRPDAARQPAVARAARSRGASSTSSTT